MTHGLRMKGRREDWGPSDNGEEASKTLFGSSGEPREEMREGVIWQKLAMIGHRWKAGSPITHGGTCPNLTGQKILLLVCL